MITKTAHETIFRRFMGCFLCSHSQLFAGEFVLMDHFRVMSPLVVDT